MPTICVFNGKAIAAGFMLGLCHDRRVMHAQTGSICMSEIKSGTPFSMPVMEVCAAKLTAATCAKLAFGVTFDQKEAL